MDDNLNCSFLARMEPTEAQLRQLYRLIEVNWRRSGLLYYFAPEPDSVYLGCYLAIFGTPITHSEWELTKAYYFYVDGSFLDEDDILGRNDNE